MHRLAGFSAYDIFTYLGCGMVAFAVADIAFGTQIVVGSGWSVGGGLFILFAAYAIGQVLAAPAEWLLEDLLVRRAIGWPSRYLLAAGKSKDDASGAGVCPYHRALSADWIRRIHARQSQDGIATLDIEGRFLHALRVAEKSPLAAARIDRLRRLYQFCRNMAFVALLGALILAICALIGHVGNAGRAFVFLPANPWGKAAIFFVAGLVLLERELAHMRLFSIEVLLGYAEAEPAAAAAASSRPPRARTAATV